MHAKPECVPHATGDTLTTRMTHRFPKTAPCVSGILVLVLLCSTHFESGSPGWMGSLCCVKSKTPRKDIKFVE